MADKESYIVKTNLFHPDLIVAAEILTIIACLWLIYEGLKLFTFFWHHEDRLTRLLSFEFLSKTLLAIVTFFMGLFLFLDFSNGVKFIVVIRPAFVFLSAYALHRLYNFYKQEL